MLQIHTSESSVATVETSDTPAAQPGSYRAGSGVPTNCMSYVTVHMHASSVFVWKS